MLCRSERLVICLCASEWVSSLRSVVYLFICNFFYSFENSNAKSDSEIFPQTNVCRYFIAWNHSNFLNYVWNNLFLFLNISHLSVKIVLLCVNKWKWFFFADFLLAFAWSSYRSNSRCRCKKWEKVRFECSCDWCRNFRTVQCKEFHRTRP